MKSLSLTRRHVLQGGALLAMSLTPCKFLLAAEKSTDVTVQLPRYIEASRNTPLRTQWLLPARITFSIHSGR